jgi:hypothetical protein
LIIVCGPLTTACGKKGPPLPPLIKLPAAPEEFTAVRRGDTVQLRFTVPITNTDRTRPANVARVEVYALTGPAPATDAELLKRAAKVASVTVKAPRDPNRTTEVDESPDEADEIEPPEGPGLDQGATARVEERLAPAALTVSGEPAAPTTIPSRTYIGVGINKGGRKGAVSKRAAVPLIPPPPPPSALNITYSESAVLIAWSPPTPDQNASGSLSYNVYEVPSESLAGQKLPETPLTKKPIADERFSDARIIWGATRCYVIRTVKSVETLTIESDAAPRACVTLKDTFPPAAPQGLTAVASERAISLIWEPNNEKDLDGYLVLRGPPGTDRLQPLTPQPIHETTFRDVVPSGAHYVYAIQAVDKAGNISGPSTAVDETAR